MKFTTTLDALLGDPDQISLHNRILSAIFLASVTISVALEIIAFSLDEKVITHAIILSSFFVYSVLYVWNLKHKNPPVLLPWIWVTLQFITVLVDWRFLSGFGSTGMILAMCVIVVLPTILRPLHAILAIGLMASSILVPFFIEYGVLLEQSASKSELVYLIDRTTTTLVIALGGSLIISMVVSSYQRQRKIIRQLNTELQASSEKIQNDNIELEELNRMKTSLFSALGHDLRNPIGAINSITALLSDEYNTRSTEEKTELLGLMHESSSSALELLNRILLWSQSEQNLISLDRRQVRLKDCIDDNMQLLELQAYSKSIAVENTCSVEHIVIADSEMLSIVFRNLLGNAIKFTPLGGSIKVEASMEDQCVQVSVIDSGVGMHQDMIEAILSGASMESNVGTADETGTGLGLRLVQSLLRKCNGSLSITSEPDQGSTFTVTLPTHG